MQEPDELPSIGPLARRWGASRPRREAGFPKLLQEDAQVAAAQQEEQGEVEASEAPADEPLEQVAAGEEEGDCAHLLHEQAALQQGASAALAGDGAAGREPGAELSWGVATAPTSSHVLHGLDPAETSWEGQLEDEDNSAAAGPLAWLQQDAEESSSSDNEPEPAEEDSLQQLLARAQAVLDARHSVTELPSQDALAAWKESPDPAAASVGQDFFADELGEQAAGAVHEQQGDRQRGAPQRQVESDAAPPSRVEEQLATFLCDPEEETADEAAACSDTEVQTAAQQQQQPKQAQTVGAAQDPGEARQTAVSGSVSPSQVEGAEEAGVPSPQCQSVKGADAIEQGERLLASLQRELEEAGQAAAGEAAARTAQAAAVQCQAAAALEGVAPLDSQQEEVPAALTFPDWHRQPRREVEFKSQLQEALVAATQDELYSGLLQQQLEGARREAGIEAAARADAEVQADSLRQQLQQAQAMLAEQRAAAVLAQATFRSQLVDALAAAAQDEQQLASLQQQLDEARKAAAASAAAHAEAEARAAALQSQAADKVAALQRRAEAAEAHAATLGSKLEDVQAALAGQRAAADKLAEQVKQEAQRAQRAAVQHAAELEGLQQERQSLGEAAVRAGARVAELEVALVDKAMEYELEASKAQSLLVALEGERARLGEMAAQHAESQRLAATQAAALVESLREEGTSLKAQLHAAHERLAEFGASISKAAHNWHRGQGPGEGSGAASSQGSTPRLLRCSSSGPSPRFLCGGSSEPSQSGGSGDGSEESRMVTAGEGEEASSSSHQQISLQSPRVAVKGSGQAADELLAMISEQQERIEQLENALQSANDKTAMSAAVAKQTIQKLMAELSRADGTLRELQGQLAEREGRLASLLAQQEEAGQELQRAQAALEQAEADRGGAEGVWQVERAQMEEEKARAEQERRVFAEELQEALAAQREASQQAAQLQAQVEELQVQVEEEQAARQAVEGQRAWEAGAAAASLHAARQEVRELVGKLFETQAVAQAVIDKLEAKLAHREGTGKEVTAQLQARCADAIKANKEAVEELEAQRELWACARSAFVLRSSRLRAALHEEVILRRALTAWRAVAAPTHRAGKSLAQKTASPAAQQQDVLPTFGGAASAPGIPWLPFTIPAIPAAASPGGMAMAYFVTPPHIAQQPLQPNKSAREEGTQTSNLSGLAAVQQLPALEAMRGPAGRVKFAEGRAAGPEVSTSPAAPTTSPSRGPGGTGVPPSQQEQRAAASKQDQPLRLPSKSWAPASGLAASASVATQPPPLPEQSSEWTTDAAAELLRPVEPQARQPSDPPAALAGPAGCATHRGRRAGGTKLGSVPPPAAATAATRASAGQPALPAAEAMPGAARGSLPASTSSEAGECRQQGQHGRPAVRRAPPGIKKLMLTGNNSPVPWVPSSRHVRVLDAFQIKSSRAIRPQGPEGGGRPKAGAARGAAAGGGAAVQPSPIVSAVPPSVAHAEPTPVEMPLVLPQRPEDSAGAPTTSTAPAGTGSACERGGEWLAATRGQHAAPVNTRQPQVGPEPYEQPRSEQAPAGATAWEVPEPSLEGGAAPEPRSFLPAMYGCLPPSGLPPPAVPAAGAGPAGQCCSMPGIRGSGCAMETLGSTVQSGDAVVSCAIGEACSALPAASGPVPPSGAPAAAHALDQPGVGGDTSSGPGPSGGLASPGEWHGGQGAGLGLAASVGVRIRQVPLSTPVLVRRAMVPQDEGPGAC